MKVIDGPAPGQEKKLVRLGMMVHGQIFLFNSDFYIRGRMLSSGLIEVSRLTDGWHNEIDGGGMYETFPDAVLFTGRTK